MMLSVQEIISLLYLTRTMWSCIIVLFFPLKISEAEFHISGRDFKFYCKPYFLRYGDIGLCRLTILMHLVVPMYYWVND